MKRTYFAYPAVALLLLACNELSAPDRMVGPMSAPTVAGFDKGGENQKVHGEGHYLLSGTYDVRFSFEVKLSADGTAKGEFRQSTTFENGTMDITGDVTCAALDPVNHRAWIGGVITKNRSTSPDYIDPVTAVGQDVWFRVVDYGKGGAAQPDRSTFLGFAGAIPTSAAYCSAQPWAAGDARTHPVTSGDIVVGRE